MMSGVFTIIERNIGDYKLVVKPVSIELIEKNKTTPIRMLLYDGTLTDSIVKLVHSWLDEFRVEISEEEIRTILSDMVSKVEKEAKAKPGISLADGDVLIFKATPLLIPFNRDLLNLFGKFHEEAYPFSPYGDSYSFGATKFKVNLPSDIQIQVILQFWTLVMKKKETIKKFEWFVKLFYMASSIPLFLFTNESTDYLDMYFEFFDLIKNEDKRQFITLFDKFYFVFLNTENAKIPKKDITSIKRKINSTAKQYGFAFQFYTISNRSEVIKMYRDIFTFLLENIYKKEFKGLTVQPT